MKPRYLFVLVLFSVLLTGCTTLPPWKPVPTGQTVVYGQIADSRRVISFTAFGEDEGIIAISVEYVVSGFSDRYAMVVDQPARNAMKGACAKFTEWARLAADNRVEITREITTVTTPQMFMRRGGWEAEGSREIKFVFVSRMDPDNTPRITLQLRSSSLFYGSDQITLTEQQAGDFGGYLQDEAVDNAYRQARKKQDTLDMFK